MARMMFSFLAKALAPLLVQELKVLLQDWIREQREDEKAKDLIKKHRDAKSHVERSRVLNELYEYANK